MIPDGGRTVRHKLAVLERHGTDVGRSPDEIGKTISTRFEPDEPADALVDRCAGLVALGFDHAVFITVGALTDETVGRLADAAGAVAPM
jgi:hypothetical protein